MLRLSGAVCVITDYVVCAVYHKLGITVHLLCVYHSAVRGSQTVCANSTRRHCDVEQRQKTHVAESLSRVPPFFRNLSVEVV